MKASHSISKRIFITVKTQLTQSINRKAEKKMCVYMYMCVYIYIYIYIKNWVGNMYIIAKEIKSLFY